VAPQLVNSDGMPPPELYKPTAQLESGATVKLAVTLPPALTVPMMAAPALASMRPTGMDGSTPPGLTGGPSLL